MPLTLTLIDRAPVGCQRLLDLGCGNGLYLTQFCKELPGIEAVGVEPDRGSYLEADELVRRNGLQNRIKLENCSATKFLSSDFGYEPDFIVMNFVLHEILSQEGEAGVVELLSAIFDRFPNLHLIVVEVDMQNDSPKVMRHELALAYYNPYYLLHGFTNQRLEALTYWERLFALCGLNVSASATVDGDIDSTGLEVGYLLEKPGHIS